MRQTSETRHLPVKLTEDELAAKAQELAESVAREEEMREAFAAWESTMKEASKAKKAGIYLAHADTVHLGEVVETGIEEREVACTWLYSKAAAYLRRDDTGELVQVRQLRDDEAQAVIGETEVVQEPTLEDLQLWSGAEADADTGQVHFPGGDSFGPLATPEVARAALETFIREHFGK